MYGMAMPEWFRATMTCEAKSGSVSPRWMLISEILTWDYPSDYDLLNVLAGWQR
jgi:hypothetical protein